MDDVLRCVVEDPRVDRLLESRGRFLGELLARLQAPLEPVLRALEGAEEELLGHEVLAAGAACGHAGCRSVVEDVALPLALRAAVAAWLVEWEVTTPAALSAPVRGRLLERMLGTSDSAAAAAGLRRRAEPDLAACSVEQLLERARAARLSELEPLQAALASRRGEAEREQLLATLARDPVHGRVRAAARALGEMGDERALGLCERYFTLPDHGGALPGLDRMRRSALAAYTRRLPGPRQLELARAWHPRGGYFAVVAGTMLEEHAEPEDRGYLERYVAQDLVDGTGWQVISELDALARLADERSTSVLEAVAEQAAYSHARRRALRGLGVIASERGDASPLLREALWDCEDEAAADACAFLPALDDAGWARVRELAASAAVEPELRGRAARRLARR